MERVLVDSNVIIDVFSGDNVWGEWSERTLAALGATDVLVINSIIYAEVSVRFTDIELVERAIPHSAFIREAIPFEAAFLAGKAYVRYKRSGGTRRSPLPDFFIGAHAAVRDYKLLTRDTRRYRSYFPTVELIAPNVN